VLADNFSNTSREKFSSQWCCEHNFVLTDSIRLIDSWQRDFLQAGSGGSLPAFLFAPIASGGDVILPIQS
jgi:hypothetical protein